MKRFKDGILWAIITLLLGGVVSTIVGMTFDDAVMMLPRYAYCRVDNIESMHVYDERPIFIEHNEVYDIATKTALPDSYVGLLLLEVYDGPGVENLSVTYTICSNDTYAETGYRDQRLRIDHSTAITKSGECKLKALSNEDGIYAIPFCITEPITFDGGALNHVLNEAQHIIIELHFDEELSYQSVGRKGLAGIISWIYRNKYLHEKIPTDMNNPKVIVTSIDDDTK